MQYDRYTLDHFQGISEYNLRDELEDLIRLAPINLLPLLVNHKNDYIKWAVNQRLSLKSDLAITSYLRLELT